MAKTGLPELDALIAAASKKFGKDFSNNDWGDIEPVDTGSTILNLALGLGGIPEGKVTEIYGWEGSGKTSLALQIIALRQKRRKALGIDKRDLLVDLEHSMTASFITGFGVDLDLVVWTRPDTAEEALQLLIDLPKSGQIDIALMDSVDAAQNSKQLSRQVGDTDVGGVSKDMNFALRQISKDNTGCTYIFINQIKQNPGVMYGSPNVTPGGNALRFYAMCRLELMRGQPSPDIPNAFRMRVKIVKTKVAAPNKEVIELDFIYGKGFEPVAELMGYAKSLNILRFAGSSVRVTWPGTTEEERITTGGKSGCLEWLSIPENYERMKTACIDVSQAND